MILFKVEKMSRWRRRLNRVASRRLACRTIGLQPTFPIVSFTFDDFPRSAFRIGGEILKRAGFLGTYYTSLGLVDSDLPAGLSFSRSDLQEVLAEGHELGCHTHDHCDAWNTAPDLFERSIVQNAGVLDRLFPGARFETLSYPINVPHPKNKAIAGKYFPCCRGGEPNFNKGKVDALNLSAIFLEKMTGNTEELFRIITDTVQHKGWLILATHDVGESPTRLGCPTTLFEEVVLAVKCSGATVLPVAQAWKAVYRL